MILSMTGYGKAEKSLSNKKVTIEIKSLNSKQIDMNVRMPSVYREKELICRQKISAELKRGKIDVSFFVENTGQEANITLNKSLIKTYYSELKEINDELNISEPLMNVVMRMPEVFKTEKENLDQNEWLEIEKLLDQAIVNLTAFRADEGKAMENDFKIRIKNIQTILDEIEKTESNRIEDKKNRLQEKINSLTTEVDKNRFEQELIYYLEKLDITEEIVRLNNHLSYFTENLAAPSQGKKLGFICQEIGREINTIGSKSNNAQMQQLVVRMKDELEKIKEQILNVL
ncbi:MAG: YicC/YloC family endoribonuclease [Flavobacteriales bacterium]